MPELSLNGGVSVTKNEIVLMKIIVKCVHQRENRFKDPNAIRKMVFLKKIAGKRFSWISKQSIA